MIVAETKAARLSKALETVAVLVDTATIEFGPEGLRVETVDPANVGEVSMTLMAGAFEKYEGQSAEIDVDIKRIEQLIQEISSDEVVKLEFDPETRELTLATDTYQFDLSLIHSDSVDSTRRAAEVEPPAKIVIDSIEIQRAIRIADMFSDEVILGVDPNRGLFYINASGDYDSMAVSFTEKDDAISNIALERAHTIFGTSYISRMLNPVPRGNEVKIELGEEFPAKFRFDIADGEGRVMYGLAPRVNE